MQIAPLAQALVPGGAGPAHWAIERAPILVCISVRMQEALTGCSKGTGCRSPAGLASHPAYVQNMASGGCVLGHCAKLQAPQGRSIHEEHDIGKVTECI